MLPVVNNTGLVVRASVTEGGTPDGGTAVIVKGTFTLVPGGPAIPAPAQRPIVGDVRYMDEIGRSLAWPTDLAPLKPFTDFLVVGSFYQPDGIARPEGVAAVRFGPLAKELRIRGPRTAVRVAQGDWHVGKPKPFTTLPMRWEYSAGGLNDPRNPFGLGQDVGITAGLGEAVPMPRIEDPALPHETPDDRHAPANFAPIPRQFAQRRAKLGTRDRRWAVFRAPLPPVDYDPSFHNVSPSGQMAGNRPIGNEGIYLLNLHPDAEVFEGALPGVQPEMMALRVDGGAPVPVSVPLHLDTVIAAPDERELVLLWRGMLPGSHNGTGEFVDAECDLLPLGAPPAAPSLAARLLSRYVSPQDAASASAIAADAGAAKKAALSATTLQSMLGTLRSLAASPAVPAELRELVTAEPNLERLQSLLQAHLDGLLADIRGKAPGLLEEFDL